ncbi:MAG: hypothetical protein WC760_07570 [Bacteroidia bacterium]|jgi:hypothetical protein
MIKPPISPIPLPEAETYTENWRNFNTTTMLGAEPLSGYLANAFTFDLADVTALMAESGINQVRIYFGYDSPEPNAGTPLPMKVMLVGVDAQGNDMIDLSPEATTSGIYDFAVPCPSYCDANSPLSS